ncbi:Armadillo repeat-containing 6 [Gossypium australe]|uniref:Armadillo repeat-containing 6 n=1 Tax=Gossypium australe TaxID=47621 RepID=A0A5B6WGL9_9ROSI|nr:Armadillo repeat-containing 6 [Gossypium australe]
MFRVLVLNVLPMAEVLHLLRILHCSCEQHRVAYIPTHSSCEQAYFIARVSNDVKKRLRLYVKAHLCELSRVSSVILNGSMGNKRERKWLMSSL